MAANQYLAHNLTTSKLQLEHQLIETLLANSTSLGLDQNSYVQYQGQRLAQLLQVDVRGAMQRLEWDDKAMDVKIREALQNLDLTKYRQEKLTDIEMLKLAAKIKKKMNEHL